jgi:hypothetical protein
MQRAEHFEVGTPSPSPPKSAAATGTRDKRLAAWAGAAAEMAVKARADAAALVALAVEVEAGGVRYKVLPRAVVVARGNRSAAAAGGGAVRRADGGRAGGGGAGLSAANVTLVTQISRNRCDSAQVRRRIRTAAPSPLVSFAVTNFFVALRWQSFHHSANRFSTTHLHMQL